MKRSFLAVVARCLAAVAALLLSYGITNARQAKTEIDFWHSMKGQSGEVLNQLVNQFNQSQGEFDVKALYKGDYTELYDTVWRIFDGKDPALLKSLPHIVQIYEAGTLSMILSDNIIPIYLLMQQQKIKVNWVDFIETVTSYYSKGGNLYSMPFNVSTPILYYNKDIFKKAGLGDKPPATWTEVETMSKKILAAGAAKCGFTAPHPSWALLENTFAWHDQLFATNENGYGGLETNENGYGGPDTKLLINNNFGLMHIGALVKWQKQNIYWPGGPEGGPDPRFIKGECALLVQSSRYIGFFKDKKFLTFNWGTGQLPHWGPSYPKQNTLLGGATLWVLKRQAPGDYKGVAQFLKFVADPRQQIWWATHTGYLPITKTAVKNLMGLKNDFYKKNPEQWTAMSQLLNVNPTPSSRGLRLGNFHDIREIIDFELENIFTGKKTVKEGLDDTVRNGNAILREFGAKYKPWPGEI
jgi:sn-glycerol 3-phosphate transport system substrate-binding protein